VSGYAREELIGRSHRVVKSRAHPDSFFEEMWRTIGSGPVWRGEVCNRAKGTVKATLDAIGCPVGLFATSPYESREAAALAPG
jgi:hypothetical protein